MRSASGVLDVVVVAFGGDAELVEELRAAGITVFVLVGTESQVRAALDEWGPDGVFAQGDEAGGTLPGEHGPIRSCRQHWLLPTAARCYLPAVRRGRRYASCPCRRRCGSRRGDPISAHPRVRGPHRLSAARFGV